MKFTAQRTELLNAVKIAIKAVNKTSPIKELEGLLFEVNENNGLINITGTDIITQITSRLKAEHIEEGGKIVLKPIFQNMLNLFDGELVEISTMDNTVKIKSNKTEYEMPLLDAKGFLKADTVFPADSIRIQSVNSLIQNTVFAAEKNVEDIKRKSMEFVKLSFSGGGTKAEATDGRCIAIASNPHCADGSLELILHEKPLQTLASLLNSDDELYVGISGKNAVFINKNMVFQTILFTGEYFDAGKLLSRFSPKYSAVADAKELYQLVNNACAIFNADDDKCINVVFELNKIRMQSVTRISQLNATINATEVIATPEYGYNFHSKYLIDCLKRTSGPVRINMDDKGLMVILANYNIFLIGPRGPVNIRENAPVKEEKLKKPKKPKAEKPKKAKSDTVKKTKTKTTAKAA